MEKENNTEYAIDNSDTLSVEYNGIVFRNQASLDNYLEREVTMKNTPWMNSLNYEISLFITSASFGVMGVLISLLYELVYKDEASIEQLPIISKPILGMLTGIVVLGISYLLPTLIFTTSDAKLRPSTLSFLTLFAGIFIDRFYEWLPTLFDNFFKPSKNKPA